MEQFELTFTEKSEEKEFGRSLWIYFRFTYAPHVINMWFWALVMVWLEFSEKIELPVSLILVALFMVIYSLVWFPNYRRQILAAMRPGGVFDKEAELHFYPNKLSYKCGENQSTIEYSSFTGYFRNQGKIILLQGNQLFGCSFKESQFGDKLDDFIACIEQAGVKKAKFFSIKRWRSTIILLILFSIIITATA